MILLCVEHVTLTRQESIT